ncbi:MAG: thiamine pyrophosphate-binding protein [Lachnospiraceae bacterium]|nr:thiamine pyrophosphate-binding protein [Lachnospiraceae bacterium]
MKIKLAEYIARFFVEKGVTDIFTITGGGAMHLNDAFGHRPELHCIYDHHEQACAIAAEGYARLSGRVAPVCVTSGPGGTNALTGVLGGFQDSIPMFVVSGQVKRETTTWSTDVPLRQLGDQEFQIAEAAKTMTKYACMVTEPREIALHLEKAWYLCLHGRKGPVWLDIPLDVQAAVIDTEDLIHLEEEEAEQLQKKEEPVFDENRAAEILSLIQEAKRPCILAGTGIRVGNAVHTFLDFIDKLGIPTVTAWNAHDLLWDDHPLYAGRPGTVGLRGGNFVIQNCDLLLVLGCRMNIRMISYTFHDFAKNARKIVVDIDEAELRKPTVKVDVPVHADVSDFMKALLKAPYEKNPVHVAWLAFARKLNAKYPAVLPAYYEKSQPINPYVFISMLSERLEPGDHVICGNGSACVVTFQAFQVKSGERLFTNSGCAAMGYGFPAAIGACFAQPESRTVCIDGDGSFMMNLQELQTVAYHQLPLKIFIINNNGYHSIRQTQSNLFKGRPLVGVSEDNGVSFPNFEKIADAFSILYRKIDSIESASREIGFVMEQDRPVLCEVVVDPAQNFEPKLSSKVLPDGRIVSPSIDDMYPFLSREEYEENHLI